MTLIATILGCGSSGGVPRIGGSDGAGQWGVCDPANPRNRRRRCSLLVQQGANSVLVDTSPDLREQMLSARVNHLDAVVMTHPHADQTNGIDDLRVLSQVMQRRVDMHADGATLAHLMKQFGYCFKTPEGSEYPPILNGHVISEPFGEFHIKTIPVRPFWMRHGRIRSLGYRFGKLAYCSDVDALDEEAFTVLDGVECWIVDALRYREHPSHAHLDLTLSWIARVKPARAVLTNLHTDLDYETLRGELPEGVEPAYDGMKIVLAD